jgi:hypothetical protein
VEHVREEDVLDEVEREHKHCGVLVGQGAQDEPRVDGAGGGVKSDGAKESRDGDGAHPRAYLPLCLLIVVACKSRR